VTVELAPQGAGEIVDPATHGRIVDAVIDPDQIEGFAAVDRQNRRHLRFGVQSGQMAGTGLLHLIVHLVVEIIDRNVERAGEIVQPRRTDAVGSAFVFLNLLECQPQRARQSVLAEAEHHPSQAQTLTDMNIDGVRTPGKRASTAF